MTIETGSKQHPTGKAVGTVETGFVEIGDLAEGTSWETHRMPDAVRAAALANAVDLACADIQAGHTSTVDGIMDLAREFEAYLTGEEANQ